MKKNIFIIGGSLRKESYNKFLASNLVEIGKNDFNFEIFSDFNLLPMYNTDDHSENNWPSALLEIGDKIKNADGVIFITPEYNFSAPGYLKNCIDWISRLPDKPLDKKPVCLQSASLGPLGGARVQYHLRQILVFLNARVMNKNEIFVTFAKTKFDETGKLIDEQTINFIKDQLNGFKIFINE